MINYINFGDFISKKRIEKGITLREMAKHLEFSAPFLSDVEKDRRNPFDHNRLEKVSRILHLDAQAQSLMYDLAGRKRNTVAPDLPEYIMERDYVSAALRTARDLDAGEADWLKFVVDLKKRKG